MRFIALAILLTLFVNNVYSQWGDNYIKLSENITTETKDIAGFDKLEVSEDFVVYIRFSDSVEKVEIEANENLHDLIQVTMEGRTLKIDTKSYSSSSGLGKRSGAEEKLVAHITAKQLTEIKADEDVVINILDKLYADELSIELDEDCTLKGHLELQKLVVILEEDSVLDVEGSAQAMSVKADEDSMVEGMNFVVGELKINLKEDSEAKLTVNGDIDLNASGDSYFYYRGEGDFVRKRLRGDSEVRSLR